MAISGTDHILWASVRYHPKIYTSIIGLKWGMMPHFPSGENYGYEFWKLFQRKLIMIACIYKSFFLEKKTILIYYKLIIEKRLLRKKYDVRKLGSVKNRGLDENITPKNIYEKEFDQKSYMFKDIGLKWGMVRIM